MNLLSKLTFLPPCNQVNHHYQFDWSASGFQFAFSGKSIELQIASHHTLYGPVILAVIVDDEVYQKIDLSEGSHAYTIPFTRNDIIYVKFIQITELQ